MIIPFDLTPFYTHKWYTHTERNKNEMYNKKKKYLQNYTKMI